MLVAGSPGLMGAVPVPSSPSWSLLPYLVPEGLLLLGALICCGVAVLRGRTGAAFYRWCSAVALVAAGGSALFFLRGLPAGGKSFAFDGLVVDGFSIFFLPLLCGFALLTVLSSGPADEQIDPHRGEYHALILTATMGATLLVSAREMIAFYVALELLSVSLYILVGITKREPRSAEAAFKYLVLGAAASAFVLYGLALLYGMSGGSGFTDVARAVSKNSAAGTLGVSLVLLGLAFKLGALPFHQWVPDLYEGAPAPISGLVGSLSKAAGFAVVIRFITEAVPSLSTTWTALVVVVSLVTMIYGNLAALRQRRLRRLLGYSSIGHAGYVLLGLLAAHPAEQGLPAILFYLVINGITLIGVFAVITALERSGVGGDLDAYRGLSQRSPLAATVLALGMASLLGIPPLAGFFAKLFVFQAAAATGYLPLVVIALAMSVVSAGYYVRVIRVVFVDDPDQHQEPVGRLRLLPQAVMVGCGAAVVVLGALAQPLFTLAVHGTAPLQ